VVAEPEHREEISAVAPQELAVPVFLLLSPGLLFFTLAAVVEARVTTMDFLVP
jgi:hypothetical protein